MAHIVQERRSAHQQLLLFVQVQLVGQYHCQMVCTQAMLEPGVIGSRIDKVGKAELFDPAQSLHLWRADQCLSKIIELNVTVNWVSDLYHYRSISPIFLLTNSTISSAISAAWIAAYFV
jgi:hypothetical protein